MTKLLRLFVLPAVFTTCASAQWTQIWADEFDQPALDTATWETMIGTGTAYGVPAGWGNDELQYYTNLAANVSVSGGMLHITARAQNFGGRNYTSARLRTLGNFEFKWGRVEASMRLPSTDGIWPALWMLPTNSPYGGWASSGEIDVLESVNAADRAYGTIHFGAPYPQNASNGGSFVPGIDLSQGFHTYAVEWDPDQIRWYLDGVQFHAVSSNQWYSSTATSNYRAPFDSPFHLLVNVAVGGAFPGNPDGTAVFPQTLDVDYIRVFRREQGPYGGTPAAIPGQIEAEDFDAGYPDEAYHDSDYGNNGNAYRTDDVDIEPCNEGGYNIGWLRAGEWIEYTASIAHAGEYTLETRVASQSTGGSFRFDLDGQDVTGPITVPPTGGWQSWQTVSATATLPAGVHTLRFVNLDASGEFNTNWFRFTGDAGCTAADLAEPFGTLNFFDISAYIALYNQQDPAADLAGPTGVWNFFDISAFVSLFNAGCP